MAAERHALESSVIEMNTCGAQIERWLRDNESKTPTGQQRNPGFPLANYRPNVGSPQNGLVSLVVLMTLPVP
jgi:hypothetical protein